MRTGDLLIGLHCDVFRTLLSDWVDVADLVSLDSAFCNTTMRPSFLEVLSTVRLRRLQKPLWKSYDSLMIWVLERGVCLIELTIHSTFSETLYVSLLKRTGKDVKEICLVWEKETTRWNILHLVSVYCKNIVKLSCCSFRDLRSICDVLRECSELSELHLTARMFEIRNSQEVIPELMHCNNLESLEVQRMDLNDSELCFILKSTPFLKCLVIPDVLEAQASHITSLKNLQKLSLFGSNIGDKALLEIVNSCTRIEHLDLSDCQSLTNPGVTEALKRLPTLRSLSLEFNSTSFTTLQEVALHHSSTLEALYTPFYVKATEVDFLLRHCPQLHTLSLCIILVDFQLLDCAVFGNIEKLILSGGVEKRVSTALIWLAPYCPKLQFFGLRPWGGYDPNTCAGLEAVVQHCTCLQSLVLVEIGRRDEITELCRVAEVAWCALRPNLTIRFIQLSYQEEEDPLQHNVSDV